jgi:hypothetical protein
MDIDRPCYQVYVKLGMNMCSRLRKDSPGHAHSLLSRRRNSYLQIFPVLHEARCKTEGCN